MSEQEIPQPKKMGRPLGGKNKNQLLLEQAQKQIEEKFGIKDFHPVIYMLMVAADDDKDESLRMQAAKSAAPFIIPQLKAIELTGDDGGPVQVDMALVNDKLRRALGMRPKSAEEARKEDEELLNLRPSGS